MNDNDKVLVPKTITKEDVETAVDEFLPDKAAYSIPEWWEALVKVMMKKNKHD